MSSGKAQFILREFNSSWTKELGRKVQLVCSEEETAYITRPADALAIQKEIAKHTDELTVVLDAFACVGGDSLAAMHIHRQADVYAVQRVRNAEEEERFGRLGRNLRQFRGALERKGKVEWHRSDIGSFIQQFKIDISLLYLDPPWAVGEDPREISTAEAIRVFLKHNVFDYLRRKSCPRLICLKLPYMVHDIEEWPDLSLSYRNVKYLNMRGKYHVHILHVIE